jgi:hypothetical protein
MNLTTNAPNQQTLTKKSNIKKWIFSITIFYIIFLPFSFYLIDLCFLRIDSIFILIRQLPTISIPVALSLMWASYYYKDYKKIKFYCFVPFFVFLILILLHYLISFF